MNVRGDASGSDLLTAGAARRRSPAPPEIPLRREAPRPVPWRRGSGGTNWRLRLGALLGLASGLLRQARYVWSLVGLLPLLGGCLVPLPLSADNPVDGGRWLMIIDATPRFGIQTVMPQDRDVDYVLDVRSDAAMIGARLYVQVNKDCCDLDVTDPQRSFFLQESVMVTEIEPGLFRVPFTKVRPCYHVQKLPMVYVIPAVATGGFIGGPTEKLEAVGTLDTSHYWTVRCE